MGSFENGVVFGGDGHLFLADGGHRVLEFAKGQIQVSQSSIDIFRENIATRKNYVQSHGAKYLHVVFPDKQSVLDVDFPIQNAVSIGQLYVDNVCELSETIIFPRKLLQSERMVFKKTDTHLTDKGTIIAAHAILRALNANTENYELERLLENCTAEREHIGDLGSRFDPALKSIERYLSFPYPVHWLHNDLSGANNGIVDLRFYPNAVNTERVIFFGDSFGRDTIAILSLYFRETLFARTPFLHEELVEMFKPDIVITENVERYMDHCRPDELRTPFMLYPFLAGVKYEPSAAFSEALAAVLSYGRTPYHNFMARFS